MRVLLIGLDAFDPKRFERLYEAGKMPNLAKYVETGRYSRFAVTNPPQSEVSWTSIATGLNPGGHGMFDFVHRDPATYALNVSLLPTKSGIGGTQFAEPFNATTIFDQVVNKGYQATALWWPALFPARVQSPVRSLPGLGTPDLLGRLGVGTFFTTNMAMADFEDRKTPVAPLTKSGNRYTGKLAGPMRKGKDGVEPSTLDLEVEVHSDTSATLQVGNFKHVLHIGEWSPVFELDFKLSRFFSLPSLTSAVVTKLDGDVCVYLLPLQVHPLKSAWHYGTPRDFVRSTWKDAGPFLTVGWPQDTAALEDGFINDKMFIDLCHMIVDVRERVLMYHLDHFQEGILASVFDTLDRMQHMFLRDYPELIDEWYMKLDGVVGRVEARLKKQGNLEKTKLIVVSDHGFADFDYKVHLNRWLVDNNFIVPKAPTPSSSFTNVDWTKSQSYAIGLNSLYLNLAGREGKGIVQQGERDALLEQMCDKLLQWKGPNGRSVVQKVWRQEEAFDGPLASYGPDLMVGFAPGFRASAQTGLGGWEAEAVEVNNDHWGADHCMDPTAVPGVLFSSYGLKNFPNPSYRDMPAIAINSAPDSSSSTPPPTSSGNESEEVIEERLKSLGYL
ncbi:MAG: alkaline phosphatase family protein [Chloroflexota bacterium]